MFKNSNRTLSQKMISKIRTTIDMGNLTSAEVQIEEYINIFGENCYISLEIARFYKVSKRYEEAIEKLENLLLESPSNEGYIIYELGQVYEELKEYDKAIEIYKTIENIKHKDKTFTYYALARLCERTYKYKEAIKYYKIIIENSERLRETAKLHLAKIYRYLNEHEKSLEILDSIITKDDVNLRCSVLLAKIKIYKKERKHELANELLDEILLKYNSNYHPAIIEKVNYYLKEKKYDEAKKIYPIIENVYTENAYFMLIKGDYNFVFRNYNKSLEYYNEVLTSKNKYHTLAYLGICRVYVALGDIKKAYEYYELVMKQNDEYYTPALLHIIQIEIFNGNYEKAFELYKTIDVSKINEEHENEYRRMKLIMEMFFNIPTVVEHSKKYSYRQLTNYDIEEAIQHIEYGHKNNEAKDATNFNNDIDIKQLLIEMKKYLKSDNIIELASAVKYLIHYPNIGYKQDIILNHLIVVKEIHNDNIITMYPCNEYGSEIIEIEEKPKQKEIKIVSQIDKFNKRYGLK